MRRIWRLGLVATVAAASFVVAIGRFSDAAEKGCAQRAPEDTSYEVRFVPEPRMDITRYRLEVTREGRPVTGADVCITSFMEGMSAMATTDTGREVAPGTYEVSLLFEMGGPWLGRVLVAEGGGSAVGIPLDFRVIMPMVPLTVEP